MHPTPRRIRLEASSHCQLRCPSCPTTEGLIDAAIGKGLLRFHDFQRLVDRNPLLESIELSNYGEIFLNPELLQILEYAWRRRVAVTIANGANLNHAPEAVLEALVRTGVATVTCSIDGVTQETYAQYRVRGRLDRVFGAIETINRYKTMYGSNRPQLIWQFIVFGHNEHEIETARAMARDLGMKFMIKLSWDEEISPVRDADHVRSLAGASSRTELREQTGAMFGEEICEQMWDSPQINWNGDVLGCCRNFWGTFGGNAFRDGLGRALSGETFNHARRMLEGKAGPREGIPCTTCEIYEHRRATNRFIERPSVPMPLRLIRWMTRAVRRLLLRYVAPPVTHADRRISAQR
jgi:MoaA/NifB/PqqE/SkfB family radical SAM enzyme